MNFGSGDLAVVTRRLIRKTGRVILSVYQDHEISNKSVWYGAVSFPGEFVSKSDKDLWELANSKLDSGKPMGRGIRTIRKWELVILELEEV